MDDVQFVRGYGGHNYRDFYHSQAVRIGNRVETAGQGGWDEQFRFPDSLHDEIVQAFTNLGRVLGAAGASWDDVVSIRSYHLALDPDTDAFMIEQMRHHMTRHAPTFTILGVERLGDPQMRVEIEAVAIIT